MADVVDSEGDAPSPMESERSDSDAAPGDIVDVNTGDETERTVTTPATLDDVTGDELSLPTDRVDTAALESLFTERTEGDADDEDDTEDHETERRDREEDGPDAEADEQTEEGDVAILDMPTERLTATPKAIQEAPHSQQPSRVSSPLLDAEPQLPPTRPSLPARPPRPAAIVAPPQPVPATSVVSNLIATTTSPPLQLITFDVGGKLFRCKASLIAKFPSKRLHHVVSCGCEQIDHATFFIDRNPQHFELILDWYRTGKCLRPLPPHVNEDALKDDAKYFDLYDEMFPPTTSMSSPPPTVPPRIKAPPQEDSPPTTALPRLPDRPARPLVTSTPMFSPPPTASFRTETTAKSQSPARSIFRYSKRDVRVVSTAEGGSVPSWFCVRDHEHLIVESVKGAGKLLVRVTDATGMARVFVDQAVLFDSRSWFYLEDDGRARLQHCVLPGNHVYTFWMESTSDQAAPSPPPPSKAAKQQGAKTVKGQPTATMTAPVKPELEVVFRLVSTFSRADEMLESDVELAAMLRAKGKGWGDASAVTPTPGNGAPQSLFLPPRHEPPIVPLPDTNDLDERDAIAEEIRALAAKERSQKTSIPTQDPQDAKAAPGGLIKRGGAAIAMASTSKPPPPGHGNEKVTVYQPIPPAAMTPRSPTKPPPPTYSAQQPRQFRQR